MFVNNKKTELQRGLLVAHAQCGRSVARLAQPYERPGGRLPPLGWAATGGAAQRSAPVATEHETAQAQRTDIGHASISAGADASGGAAAATSSAGAVAQPRGSEDNANPRAAAAAASDGWRPSSGQTQRPAGQKLSVVASS